MTRIVKKFADRKAEIIQAARGLFQKKEYEKTSMQDVIDAVGIAKGTIYHYFKSKEELLEAVIEDIVDENLEEMHALVEEGKGDAIKKMKQLIKKGNIAAKNPQLLNQLHKPGNQVMHCRLLAAILNKQAPLYAKLIKQGCQEGIFKTENPLESAEFIFSAVQFLTDTGIYPWDQKDLNRRIQAFPNLIENQLKAPPNSFKFLREALKK